jgi:hypothetical protein
MCIFNVAVCINLGFSAEMEMVKLGTRREASESFDRSPDGTALESASSSVLKPEMAGKPVKRNTCRKKTEKNVKRNTWPEKNGKTVKRNTWP